MINPDQKIKELFQLYKKEKDIMSPDQKRMIRDLIGEYKNYKGLTKLKIFKEN